MNLIEDVTKLTAGVAACEEKHTKQVARLLEISLVAYKDELVRLRRKCNRLLKKYKTKGKQ